MTTYEISEKLNIILRQEVQIKKLIELKGKNEVRVALDAWGRADEANFTFEGDDAEEIISFVLNKTMKKYRARLAELEENGVKADARFWLRGGKYDTSGVKRPNISLKTTRV